MHWYIMKSFICHIFFRIKHHVPGVLFSCCISILVLSSTVVKLSVCSLPNHVNLITRKLLLIFVLKLLTLTYPVVGLTAAEGFRFFWLFNFTNKNINLMFGIDVIIIPFVYLIYLWSGQLQLHLFCQMG